jgi:succinylglutamate desuccinylase
MFDFLAETIQGDQITSDSGKAETLTWHRPAPGVIAFEPKVRSNKSVVISVGIHGNETAPIEIVSTLVSKLLTGHYSLKVRLLIIIGNLKAMRQGERYLKIDMNRLFSDHYQRHESCYETQRAQKLQQIMNDFYCAADHSAKLHFDLHTAIRSSHHLRFGLLPYLNSGHYNPQMITWLQHIGLEAVVINHVPAATFSYFSSNEFGAASCTLELGKAKPLNENDLQQFTGIQRGLVNLISDQSNDVLPSTQLQVYKVAEVLIKSSEQFKLNVADDVKNFTPFAKGFILSRDGDTQYRVQQETGYILFPNNHVKIGFRAGLFLQKENLSEIIKISC